MDKRNIQFNRKRVQWCCTQFGITMETLANKLKLKNINKVDLTFNQIKKIADYLGRGILFFFESGMPSEELVYSPQFRTIENKKLRSNRKNQKLIRRVEDHRDFYIGMLEDLGEEEKFFQKPDLSGPIQDKSEQVRDWLGLDLQKNGSFNLYRDAIQDKGILVFQSMWYSGNWKLEDSLLGFSLSHEISPIIFIKKSSPPHQTFTMMHELGHLLLHPGSYVDEEEDFQTDCSKKEQEANQFAGLCLVPNQILNKIINPIPAQVELYDDFLKKQSDRLGTSVEVILRRLLNKGRLSKQKYEEYRKHKKNEYKKNEHKNVQNNQPGRRRYRPGEPLHIFGKIYVSTVFNSLASKHITLNKASDYLDRLNIVDIHKLEHKDRK